MEEGGGEKKPNKKLVKYPKVKQNVLFKQETKKETYLDKYYSKDFLQDYFQ